MQDGPYEKLYLAHETDVSETGPSVTISVHGRHHSMTVQEISVMPVSEFAFLWTVRSISLLTTADVLVIQPAFRQALGVFLFTVCIPALALAHVSFACCVLQVNGFQILLGKQTTAFDFV